MGTSGEATLLQASPLFTDCMKDIETTIGAQTCLTSGSAEEIKSN